MSKPDTRYQEGPRRTVKGLMDDDLLPTELEYSIVHRDRRKPPGHPEEEVKMYETDEAGFEDVPLPPDHVEISVLAYGADGEIGELNPRSPRVDARDRVLDAVDEMRDDE